MDKNQILSHLNLILKFTEDFEPLANIADKYYENGLDDEARYKWGIDDEHVNDTPHDKIILYTGRGGGTLLTLKDCTEGKISLQAIRNTVSLIKGSLEERLVPRNAPKAQGPVSVEMKREHSEEPSATHGGLCFHVTWSVLVNGVNVMESRNRHRWMVTGRDKVEVTPPRLIQQKYDELVAAINVPAGSPDAKIIFPHYCEATQETIEHLKKWGYFEKLMRGTAVLTEQQFAAGMIASLTEERVYGFYEGEYPSYASGLKAEHDLASPVTADELNGLVSTINAQREEINKLKHGVDDKTHKNMDIGKKLIGYAYYHDGMMDGVHNPLVVNKDQRWSACGEPWTEIELVER